MRSKAATPLIERKHCIEHETVFVAKVRAKEESPGIIVETDEGQSASSSRARL
jgi:hypothetical protein